MSTDPFSQWRPKKSLETQEDVFAKWRPSKKKDSIPEPAKIVVSAPAEFLGGAVGAIPGLATQTAALDPLVEYLEEEARPSYLSSTGLEPVPEKGLNNLLSLIGQIPGIENFTPEALREKFQSITEEKFVPESTLGKGIARGSSLAGQAAGSGSFGFPNLARIALGGIAGETLREMGAPEGIATGAEILSPFLTASLGKKITFNASEKQLFDLGKKIGLTDQQLAAVLKSPKAQATFAKFASKGEKAENLVSDLFDKLGDNYSSLKTEGRSQGYLSGAPVNNLIKKWENTLHDLKQTHTPSPDKASAINYIEQALEDIRNYGTTPEKLINTYQDINRTVNWNSWSSGKKQLAALKEPIKTAITQANPTLGKEFGLTNDLYKKSIQLAKVLKPSQLENLLAHGHAGEIALALATWNPGLLNKYLGFLGGRQLSRVMLFSPRFNKMHLKMLDAIKNNDTHLINQGLQEFSKAIQSAFPEEAQDFSIPQYD